MEIVNLVIAVYNLLVRAVALALSDPEFAADWKAVENALEAMGVDVPGYEPNGAQGGTSESVVTNADGSKSLAGEQ